MLNIIKKIAVAASCLLVLTEDSMAQNTNQCVDYIRPGWNKTVHTVQGQQTFYWNPEAWNFNPMTRVRKRTLPQSQWIAQDQMFRGLMEFTPEGYNPSDFSRLYPVLIFFHGGASAGDGSDQFLCRLFKDDGEDMATHLSIPGRMERNLIPLLNNYIVIMPQFRVYNRPLDETAPSLYPSAEHLDAVIDYVIQNYRANPRRIFMTGYSNGANMISEYAGSSVQRARRLAGIMPVAFCSNITSQRNIQKGVHPSRIGEARLPAWFVQCNIDRPCDTNFVRPWVDTIRARGNTRVRYTLLEDSNPNPLYQCSDTLSHDAWSRAYDPTFRISYNRGYRSTGNDNVNLNMVEWFNSLADAVLPVTLKTFTARFVNGVVELEWITTDEKDNKSFTIQRAGDDQKFGALAEIPGAGDHIGEKKYTYTDTRPLTGLNFYRLVQTDRDGQQTFFDIRRVLNAADNQSAVIVSPNPFNNSLSAFVNLTRSQRLLIVVTDLNGKVVKTANGIYGAGNSEVKLQSNDLAQGIYLLKITGEDFSIVQKVVKR